MPLRWPDFPRPGGCLEWNSGSDHRGLVGSHSRRPAAQSDDWAPPQVLSFSVAANTRILGSVQLVLRRPSGQSSGITYGRIAVKGSMSQLLPSDARAAGMARKNVQVRQVQSAVRR